MTSLKWALASGSTRFTTALLGFEKSSKRSSSDSEQLRTGRYFYLTNFRVPVIPSPANQGCIYKNKLRS
jgi:hypothetical protein